MTKFADKTFSVTLGGRLYREGWDRVFGKLPRLDAVPVPANASAPATKRKARRKKA